MNIEELMELSGLSEHEARLLADEQRYERGADAPNTRANYYGYTSPLQAAADMLGRNKAKRGLRDADAEQAEITRKKAATRSSYLESLGDEVTPELMAIVSGDPQLTAAVEYIDKQKKGDMPVTLGGKYVYDPTSGISAAEQMKAQQEAADAVKKADRIYEESQKTANDIRDHKQALELARVKLEEKAKEGTTKPPAGYRFKEGDPTVLEPITGGPHDPDRPKAPTAQEAKQFAQFDTAIGALEEMQTLYDTGNVDIGQFSGALTQLANKPGPIGGVASWAEDLTEEEQKMYVLQEKVGVQIIAAMRGAQVGPKEEERFVRQLPRMDQSPEVFQTNLTLTMENLETMRSRMQELRPVPSGSGVQTAPPAPTRAPAEGGTVSIGDVAYGFRFTGGDPNDPNSWEKVQ